MDPPTFQVAGHSPLADFPPHPERALWPCFSLPSVGWSHLGFRKKRSQRGPPCLEPGVVASLRKLPDTRRPGHTFHMEKCPARGYPAGQPRGRRERPPPAPTPVLRSTSLSTPLFASRRAAPRLDSGASARGSQSYQRGINLAEYRTGSHATLSNRLPEGQRQRPRHSSGHRPTPQQCRLPGDGHGRALEDDERGGLPGCH